MLECRRGGTNLQAEADKGPGSAGGRPYRRTTRRISLRPGWTWRFRRTRDSRLSRKRILPSYPLGRAAAPQFQTRAAEVGSTPLIPCRAEPRPVRHREYRRKRESLLHREYVLWP